MIADLETVTMEIERLAKKTNYPGYDEPAKLELVRIATKYARDLTHLREIVGSISEGWDHCPDGRELREALTQAETTVPTYQARSRCKFEICDGSGWVEVFALHTYERGPAGGAFTRKEWLTFDQWFALDQQKLDPQKQVLFTGRKRCECHPARSE